MGELKRIRVREARIRDLGLFRKLWMGLLETRVKQGSLIQASEQSMQLYEHLFKQYTDKQFEGIVLFVADQGVLMIGANNPLLEYRGKTAINWGTYSNGNDAIKTALLERADAWAIENGFVGIITERFGNSAQLTDYNVIGTISYKKLNNG